MNGDPQPLAVGLLDVTEMSLVQQVTARTRMADVARAEGYAVLEILSVGGDRRRRDADMYTVAAALVRREGAVAFLVHGDVDQARLRRATADLTVRVVHAATSVPLPGSPGSAAGACHPSGRLVTLGGDR